MIFANFGSLVTKQRGIFPEFLRAFMDHCVTHDHLRLGFILDAILDNEDANLNNEVFAGECRFNTLPLWWLAPMTRLLAKIFSRWPDRLHYRLDSAARLGH